MVYLDDVILTGTSVSYIDSVKLLLDDKFKIKDLGSLKYIVGFGSGSTSQMYHFESKEI